MKFTENGRYNIYFLFVSAIIFQLYIQRKPKILSKNKQSNDVCGKKTMQIDPKFNVSFVTMRDQKQAT